MSARRSQPGHQGLCGRGTLHADAELRWIRNRDKLTLSDLSPISQPALGVKRDGVRRQQWSGTLPPMNDRFHDEVMSTFGKKLREARESAGFETAKQFAEALGVEENRYRHWERGSAQPNLPMLVRITRLLKVELSDLIPHAYQKKDRDPSSRRVAS